MKLLFSNGKDQIDGILMSYVVDLGNRRIVLKLENSSNDVLVFDILRLYIYRYIKKSEKVNIPVGMNESKFHCCRCDTDHHLGLQYLQVSHLQQI